MIHPAVVFIAWQHLCKQPIRSLLMIFSFALASAMLMLMSTLSLGVERLVTQRLLNLLPDNMVEINIPETQFSFLQKLDPTGSKSASNLSPKLVQALQNLTGVHAVYPRLPVPIAFSAQGGERLLGHALRTDVFVDGVDPNLFLHESFGAAFAALAQPAVGMKPVLPVVLSSKLLDLYNQMVAPSLKTPRLTATDLVGFEFDLQLGTSVLAHIDAPQSAGRRRARVVGFSPYAATLGLSIPLAEARAMRAEYAHLPPTQESYSRILLEVENPKTLLQLLPQIARMGLQVDQSARHIQTLIATSRSILQSTGLCMLLMAGWFLGYLMWLYGDAQRHHFALLQALGLTAKDILMLLMSQAVACGFAGGILGWGSAAALVALGDNLLAQHPALNILHSLGFLHLPWQLAIGCVALTLLTAILGGLPAARHVWRQAPSASLQR